jgi:hypothetical protein
VTFGARKMTRIDGIRMADKTLPEEFQLQTVPGKNCPVNVRSGFDASPLHARD